MKILININHHVFIEFGCPIQFQYEEKHRIKAKYKILLKQKTAHLTAIKSKKDHKNLVILASYYSQKICFLARL